ADHTVLGLSAKEAPGQRIANPSSRVRISKPLKLLVVRELSLAGGQPCRRPELLRTSESPPISKASARKRRKPRLAPTLPCRIGRRPGSAEESTSYLLMSSLRSRR